MGPEDILELELLVSRHRYMGMPIGPVINDLLVKKIYRGEPGWGLLDFLRDGLKLTVRTVLYLVPRRVQLPDGFLSQNRGKILCTWIKDKPSLSNLVLPLVRQLGPENTMVIGPRSNMAQMLPEGTAFLAYTNIPIARPGSWFFEYLSASKGWLPSLLRAFQRLGLGRGAVIRFQETLMISAREIASYMGLLRELNPPAVITESDRNRRTAPLIIAAKSLGIPTFTMLHGMINSPVGYVPIVADRVFAWGQHSKRTLREFGVPSEKILVTGYQALHPTGLQKNRETLGQIGIQANRPVVLLATNPIKVSARKRFAASFCRAFPQDSLVTPIVRLHPAESLSGYDREIRDFPHVLFLENESLTLEESLAISDVVVCHNSGYGLDALAHQKPVVILNSVSEPLLGAKTMVELGGCPVVENAAALSSEVAHILADDEYRRVLKNRSKGLVSEVFESFGDEAAARIAAEVFAAVSIPRE